MDRNDAIEKVRKLLRLSESPNENEAASAAGKAQQLMSEYEIQAEALAISTDDQADTLRNEPIMNYGDGDPLDSNRGHKARWAWRLAIVIARANGCKIYTMRRTRQQKRISFRWNGGTAYKIFNEIAIIGRPTDVATVRVMYACLSEDVIRLHNAQRGNSAEWKAAYVVGVVEGVEEAIRMSRVAAEDRMRSQANNATALMVVNRAIVNVRQRVTDTEAWAKQNLVLGPGRATSWGLRDQSARERGREDGRKVNIGGVKGRIGSRPKEIA